LTLTLLGLVSLFLSGAASRLDAFLIGVSKPDGSVRLIAIGEVYFRLTGLCFLAACPDAGRALAPLQVSVGMSGGSRAAAHAITAGMANGADIVTMKLDSTNAFYLLHRGAMLAAVTEAQPALLPRAPSTT
jgi:hypothetical protein